MLEFLIEKLFVPSSSPFDRVIMSKYIVSFRFLDNEWIDVMPNRIDYKRYRGSQGTEQHFHGGKSLVVSVPSSFLNCGFENVNLEIRARREISRYFAMEEHIQEIGSVLINVDELLNAVVTELRLRRELGDYLTLVHERDPISRSMKGTYTLQDAKDDSLIPQLDLYLRFSYLGSNVVTEIDKLSHNPFFYAQEETNLANTKQYECCELDSSGVPTSKSGPSHFRGQLQCCCTEEQRNRALQPDCMKTQETNTSDGTKKKDGPKGPKVKKSRKITKEKGTEMEPYKADKGTGTETIKPEVIDSSKGLSDEDRLKLLKSKRRGGGAVVMIDKPRKTCFDPCVESAPCCPTDICIPQPVCFPVCLPAPDPAVYCCD